MSDQFPIAHAAYGQPFPEGSPAVTGPEASDVVRESPARRPWYLRWYTIAGAVAAILGLAAGIIFGFGLIGSAKSPAEVLKADGYSVMMDLSGPQFQSFAGKDSAELSKFVTSAVVGMKDGRIEMVVGLTASGRDYVKDHASEVPTLGGSLSKGVTASVRDGNIVVSGPMSAFGS